MKSKIAWLLVLMMLVALWPPISPLQVRALDVGSGATVTNVKFIKQHVGYDVTGGNVIIIGTDLEDINVLFEVKGGIPTALGTLHQDSNAFFLNYVFSFEDADSFTGKIYIGNKIINLNTPNFPNITSSSTAIVNQDQSESITINGSNLQLIDNVNVKATYGRGIQQNRILDDLVPPGQQATNISFQPTAPGALGFQDITLNQEIAGDPLVEVTYYYQNAFRLLKDLDLAPVVMYPNAASRGDFITLTSNNFSDSKNYRVYFLNPTDNDFAFSDTKMSPSVTLSQDKQRMVVQVPTSPQFALGSKRVVVVDIQNNEIVARFNVPETFNLIDAVFKPLITRINPAEGTDEGANLQVIGRNLITPNIPELVAGGGGLTIQSALPSNADQVMNLTFNTAGLTFKGLPVTSLTREVRSIISKQAFFEVVAGSVKYSKIGADDYLYIRTDVIDDAATDPLKDVVVELDTEIVTNDGQVFTFSQAVTVIDGFKFIPSSLLPEITGITPDKVQISAAFNPKEDTMLSITGSNFLVNKYTDATGIIKTNYPVVLIQITDTIGDDSYVVKFDRNDLTGSPQGTVYDLNGPLMGVPVDMVVLDAQNRVVDGSVGNEIGSRIVLYLPRDADIGFGGKKNIQVINPKRGSDSLGTGKVVLDFLDFVIASDTPVIESVTPNIVTAESQAEIVIVGANFQDGVKVFIDGKDVGQVERAIDPQGNNMTLTFKAPIGRITKTQLQVLNPLGGIAVRDFYYVQSFNQDPEIIAISPNKGTSDTLVVVSGDNFFKPDAAAETSEGLDAFRLLGTRLFLDGEDINGYQKDVFGNIDYVAYTSPDSNYDLFYNESGVIRTSPFYKNALVTSSDDAIVYEWAFDENGNPQLHDGNKVAYTFKYSTADGYQAFNGAGDLLGSFTQTPTQLSIGGASPFTLKVRMDNRLIRPNYTLNKELHVKLADYWNSVVLKDAVTGDYYTVTELPDGAVRLSNGQFNVFTLKTTGSDIDNPGFRAVDALNQSFTVTISQAQMVVNTATPLQLNFETPYLFDNVTKRIVGNRVRVENKNKLIFYVPNLISSTGLKDVMVVNPDTKSDTLLKSFYYYQLPGTQPAISSITPNIGSVEGGYIVSIKGKDFKESSQVYFDGILVPAADKVVNLAGTEIQVKVPKYPIDIAQVFGVGRLTVPVVVVNNDGGTASRLEGFTYVKPASQPKLTQIVLNKGSTNGGEVVEIIGEDFRFFEPFNNLGGTAGYDEGVDTFTNFNSYLPVTPKWDNLLAKRMDGLVDLWEELAMPGGANYFGYDYYYASNVLPKVYFGTELAKIVDFDTDYIKVITPPNAKGIKNVIVMNNDSGVSNALPYTYEASSPRITFINPNQGARTGDERREIVGSGFAAKTFNAYQDDDATTIVNAGDKVEALVQFGVLSNTKIALGQPNDGRINANRATVNIEGGLKVSYDGNAKTFDVSIEEGGVIYTRTFTNYEGQDVFVPAGMLKNGANYYQPVNSDYATPTVYNTATDYEWIRIQVDPLAKRLFVTRGFAPKVEFENSGKLNLYTPSYYTIDQVVVTVYNPDGGLATTSFRFTNPASKPLIYMVNPEEIIPPNSVENNTAVEQRMVQATISGGVSIEIKGKDFRDGVKVFLGTKQAEVLDIVEDEINDLQVIIARVPAGQTTDIGSKLPIIVENTDGGIANSTDTAKLGPDKRLIYFIYRKPLSLPVINQIVPNKTSQFGGNTVEIRGTDFRSGAMVIIGSIGGVPVTPSAIEDVGRFIRFVVPQNLTPGTKDIQVINKDFGTVTANGGLTIISYPIVDDEITMEETGLPVNVVLTPGGERLKITGKNFQSGAKVIFGGTRILQVSGQTGEVGFFKDDKTYVIQGGTASPKVEFVDANTLIVTTPEVFEEKTYSITVLNPDTGVSDQNANVRYSVPVPSAPTTLKVQIVDNAYIRLYDYAVDRVKYYEIYVYMGAKTSQQLLTNGYRDFRSLGTTAFSPYKVSRLDGFEKLTKTDSIFFVVKAVNEYGSSSWSNIASLGHTQFKDVVALGDPGLTGSLLPTLGNTATSSVSGSLLEVVFTDKGFSGSVNVNLSSSAFSGVNDIKVVMPDIMASLNVNRMQIEGKWLGLSYVPVGFANDTFRANNTSSMEFITWRTSWMPNAASGSALSLLPTTVKVVSPVVTMSQSIANNMGSRSLGALSIPVDVKINTGAQEVAVKTSSYQVYHYDLNTRKWSAIPGTYNATTKQLATQWRLPGYYVVTVKR